MDRREFVAAAAGSVAGLTGGCLSMPAAVGGRDGPAVAWTERYDSDDGDVAYDLTRTTDGDLVLAGESYGVSENGTTDPDAWVAKLSASGDERWNRATDQAGIQEARAVAPGPDGGCAVLVWNAADAGSGADADETTPDAELVGLDAAGERLWSRRYAVAADGTPTALVRTADGYALAGRSRAGAWLVTTGDGGDPRWSRAYGDGLGDAAQAVAPASDGGLVLARTTSTSSETGFAWLRGLGPDGDERWYRSFEEDGDGSATVNAVLPADDAVGPAEGYVLAGTTAHMGGPFSAWLRGVSGDGREQWLRRYDGLFDADVVAIPADDSDSADATGDDALGPAGGYVLAGRSQRAVELAAVGPDGERAWHREYGGVDTDVTYAVERTGTGGLAVLGKVITGSVGDLGLSDATVTGFE